MRGAGLLIGLDLTEAASAEVFAAALEAGFIVNNPTPERVRLAPPLILTAEQADSFLDAWPGILDAAYERGGSHDAPLPARRRPVARSEQAEVLDAGA